MDTDHNSMGGQEKAPWERVEELEQKNKLLKVLLNCILRMFEKYVTSGDTNAVLEDMRLLKKALEKTEG